MKYILKNKDINSLIHFTDIENLESILDNGLKTRRELKKNNIKFKNTDNKRFDNFQDSLSMSIEFPNYKLLFHKQNEDGNPSFVILKIKATTILNKKVLFNTSNAASKEMRDLTIKDKQSLTMFNQMFEDSKKIKNFLGHYTLIKRDSLNIPKNYTTNPQAEILILDDIKTIDITHVVFKNTSDLEKFKYLELKYPNIIFEMDNQLFEPRCDWRFWK